MSIARTPLVLIPTRGRPEKIAGLLDCLDSIGPTPEAAVMLDDDRGLYDDIIWPNNWHVYRANTHLELTASVNNLFKIHSHRSSYIYISDLCRPRTPGWIDLLDQEVGRWGIACTADGLGDYNPQTRRQRLCGAIAVGGDLVRTLGWMLYPETVHLGSDDVLLTLAARLDGLRRRDDILVETVRPVRGQASWRDLNHDRVFNGSSFARTDLEARDKAPIEELARKIREAQECNPLR